MVLCWAASGAAAQVFDPAKVGAPLSGALAELYLPAGAAPVGAVVVLHGCDGIEPHYRQWAQRIADWGYAALLIDSFGPRGFQEICNRGLLVPPEAQARDAFDGAAYLRAAPQVHAQRVGVIGFSHGGWAVLKAVLAGLVRRPNEPAFAAAVAFYPGCDPRDPPGRPLETDTLILIGDGDDWTPATRCAKWRDAVQTHGDRRRSVLAGLRNERLDPKAELEGRQALFVVNLAPRKMAGQISEAMLLDIGYADGITPVLAIPERPIPNGVRAG